MGETIALSGFDTTTDATEAVNLKNSDGTDFLKGYTATVDNQGLRINVVPEPSTIAAIIGLASIAVAFARRVR